LAWRRNNTNGLSGVIEEVAMGKEYGLYTAKEDKLLSCVLCGKFNHKECKFGAKGAKKKDNFTAFTI
jgi:hypothetical protein